MIDSSTVASSSLSSTSSFTSASSNSSSSLWLGLITVLTGAICFGTVYVPIKRCTRQNQGLTVQWLMSLGSLLVAFVVNTALGCPRMYLLATAGGALWTIANTIAQFVVVDLGLAVALQLWNTTNVLTAWAAGRFGLFGLKQKLPEHNGLNLLGLGLVLVGGSFFAIVKRCPPLANREHQEFTFSIPKLMSNRKNSLEINKTKKTQFQAVESDQSLESSATGNTNGSYNTKCNNKWSKTAKRMWAKGRHAIAVLLALLSGFFYSSTVMPVIYIQDHQADKFPDAPKNGLNFIFSHYFGIFLTSTTIFIFYAVVRGNRPNLNPTIILPSILAGIIWGCGMVCLFLSNDLLTQTITYPVLITIPGCVAALWSIFYFKEIKMDRQNSLVLGTAFTLIFTGATFVFLSKIKF